MEKRLGDCEMDLRDAHKEIRTLESKIQGIAIDKQALCGKIDLLKTQIQNVDSKIEELKILFLDYKKEQKNDVGELTKDIKSIHDCMANFKAEAVRSSTVISIIIPIIVLAIAFTFGLK
jgi:chromosome segregation ATPase